MANKGIKGITIEIGGDTTQLEKALSGVNGKVRNTQAELREVNKLLKMDPGNTEALAQKQTILSEAIAETKEKLDILKTAERQVQEQFQRGEVSGEQYRALKREIERTSLELEDLEEAAAQADKAVEDLEEAAAQADRAVEDLEEAADQADEAVEELGKSSALSGEELKKAEEKAGTFKEKLGKLGEAAEGAAKALGAGFVAAATYATKCESIA